MNDEKKWVFERAKDFSQVSLPGIDAVKTETRRLAHFMGPEFVSATVEEFCKIWGYRPADLERCLKRNWIQHDLRNVEKSGHAPGRHPTLLIKTRKSSRYELRLYTPILRLSLLDQPYAEAEEQQTIARNYFLQVIAEIDQKVLRDLLDNVWTPWHSYPETMVKQEVSRWAARHNLVMKPNGNPGVTVPQFVPEWVLQRAEKTLRYWTRNPDLTKKTVLTWGIFSYGAAIWSEEAVNVEIPLHRPVPGPLTARTIIYSQLECYAREHKLERTAVCKQLEKFVWAVRFQVLEERASRIAASVRGVAADQRTINHGISSVLRLVGLRRRQEKPSRKELQQVEKTIRIS
jgi:hypothetical protein